MTKRYTIWYKTLHSRKESRVVKSVLTRWVERLSLMTLLQKFWVPFFSPSKNFSKNWSGLSTLSVPKLSLVRHCKVHKDVFGGRSYWGDLYTVNEVCGKLRYGHCPDIDFFVCLVSEGSKAGAKRNTPMQWKETKPILNRWCKFSLPRFVALECRGVCDNTS